MNAHRRTGLAKLDLHRSTLAQYVEFGQERRGVEFKSSTDWSAYATKFTKGIMAMANKRDGGVIIIGRDPNNSGSGIDPQHLASYDIDVIQPFVNRHADPHIEVALQRFEHGGVLYLAIGVEEFREVPVICQRDSSDSILEKGAIYVRSFRTVETTVVQTPEDMRELLELSIAKGVERFVRTAGQAGVQLGDSVAARSTAAFEAQARRMFE